MKEMTKNSKTETSVIDQVMSKVPKKVKSFVLKAIDEIEAKAEDAQEAKVRNVVKVDLSSLYSRAYLDLKSYTKDGLTQSKLFYLQERLEKYSKRAHNIVEKPQNKAAFANNSENEKLYDNQLNKVHIIDGLLATTVYNGVILEKKDLKRLKKKDREELESAQARYENVLSGKGFAYSTYKKSDLDDTAKFIQKNAPLVASYFD